MTESPTRPTRPPGWGLPIGIGMGSGIGLILGILLDQIALGLAFGAAVGLVAGVTLTTIGEVPPERRTAVVATAVAILVAGLGVAAMVVLS